MKFLQEGGAMPQNDAQAQQEQMVAQLQQVAQNIIQQMGPEAAMMLAQMITEMVQGAGQLPAEEQQPTFSRNGGKLQRIS